MEVTSSPLDVCSANGQGCIAFNGDDNHHDRDDAGNNYEYEYDAGDNYNCDDDDSDDDSEYDEDNHDDDEDDNKKIGPHCCNMIKLV